MGFRVKAVPWNCWVLAARSRPARAREPGAIPGRRSSGGLGAPAEDVEGCSAPRSRARRRTGGGDVCQGDRNLPHAEPAQEPRSRLGRVALLLVGILAALLDPPAGAA